MAFKQYLWKVSLITEAGSVAGRPLELHVTAGDIRAALNKAETFAERLPGSSRTAVYAERLVEVVGERE